MSRLQIGQVLSLMLPLNNSDSNTKLLGTHPYIVFEMDEISGMVELIQLSSLDGKEYEALNKHNKVIYKELPDETVIDKDSIARLNYKITVDLFAGLVQCRRQKEKLSDQKFNILKDAYISYQLDNAVEDSNIIYVSEQQLKEFNHRIK